MKKKLKIYSVLLVVGIAYLMLSNIGYVRTGGGDTLEGESLTFEVEPEDFVTRDTIDENTIHFTEHLSFQYNVHVTRRQHERALMSYYPGGERYRVDLDQVRLSMPKMPESIFLKTFLYGGIAIHCGLLLWIFVLVCMLAKDLRRGNFFIERFCGRMEVTGWLLIIFYAWEVLASYLYYLYVAEHVKMAFHRIIFVNDVNFMFLLMGLTLLIVSQIVLVGKSMKEEQELTV